MTVNDPVDYDKMTLNDYVCLSEGAKMLGLSHDKMQLLCRNGRFPGAVCSCDDRWMIPKIDIKNFKSVPFRPKSKPNKGEELITTNQAAELLSVSKECVSVWCRQGVFPGADLVDRKWLIPKSDVENLNRDRPSHRYRISTTKILGILRDRMKNKNGDI